MKVIGYRDVSFPDKNDPNKKVTGIRLFCTYPIAKGGEGFGTESIYLSDWLVQNRLYGEVPKIGDEIFPSYNRFGKIDDIRIVPSEN